MAASAPAKPFLGDYAFLALEGEGGLEDVLAATWGTITVLQDGRYEDLSYRNEQGRLEGPLVGTGLTYEVAEDRVLRLGYAWLPGSTHLAGGIGADGLLGVVGAVAEGARPALRVFLRGDPAAPVAPPSGVHHACGLLKFAPYGAVAARWGTWTFDGRGGLAGTLTENAEGVVAAVPGAAGTYAVDADGAVRLALAEGEYACAADRPEDALLFHGGTGEDDMPSLWALVPRAGGLSPGTFAGEWFVATLSFLPQDLVHVGWTGMLTAHASGAFVLEGEAKTGREPARPLWRDGSWTLAADGAVSLAPIGTAPLRGAVAPSGRFAMAAGGDKDGAEPTLWLLVRR